MKSEDMSRRDVLIRIAIGNGRRVGYIFKAHVGSNGSIYVSFQVPKGYDKNIFAGSELSIHSTGDTFINPSSKYMGSIPKNTRQSIRNGLGYSDDEKGGDEVYTKSIKVSPLDSISEIVHIPWSGFIKSAYIDNLRGVSKTDSKYQIFNIKGYSKVLVNFSVAPDSSALKRIINQITIASNSILSGYVLPHPLLPIHFCIVFGEGD